MAINTTFDIEVHYSGDPAYLGYFQAAAVEWEKVIVADIPDVTNSNFGFVDDLLIDASVASIDGLGGILGQAGPDWIRSDSHLPFHGEMEFDSADVASMVQRGLFLDVVMHEMGHILGFGTLWDDSKFNLIDPNTHEYFGAHALAEYRALTGNPAASFIPVEDGGGPGTMNSHWDEETFNAELMTGFVESSGTPMPLSRMTIASLWDLGYAVNLNAADPYSLPGGSPAVLPGATASNDLLIGSAAADTIDGLGGNDTVYGLAGDDRLFGSAGDDILVGGAGMDLLEGGTGINLASYEASSAAVRIDLAFTSGTGGDAERDVLHDIQNVFGSAFDDLLIGTSASNNLYGLDGNDALAGGAGADFLDGGKGENTAYYDTSPGAIQVNLAVHAGLGADAQGDMLFNVQNVIGSDFADVLVGDDAANTLTGGRGADWLTGGAGNDVFLFRSGEANGDILFDFDGKGASAGDQMVFAGYGADASFTQVDATHWQVNYHGGTSHDLITFTNGAAGAIHPSDYMFV